MESEEGQAWALATESYRQLRNSYPFISATIDRDGSFRIDDVPPGDYVLRLRFDRDAPGSLPETKVIVPEEGNGSIDLGVLTLE